MLFHSRVRQEKKQNETNDQWNDNATKLTCPLDDTADGVSNDFASNNVCHLGFW